jgi:hypothetical protein
MVGERWKKKKKEEEEALFATLRAWKTLLP